MNKTWYLIFIIVFCAVIYSVPAVQTGYEFFTNNDHRIQMADLAEDLFITPLKKKKTTAATLDSLLSTVDIMRSMIQTVSGSALPEGEAPDYQRAVELADEASWKIKDLQQSILAYNRHIKGEHNRFMPADTTKPFYRALVNLQSGFELLMVVLQSEQPADTLLSSLEQLQGEVEQARTLYGPYRGLADFPSVTLTAIRRNLVGDDYLRPYEKEMEESSLFARTIRPWMRLRNYLLFTDLGDKGVRGKKGWCFYRPGVDYLTRPSVLDKRSAIVDPNDIPLNDAVIDSICRFRDQLSALDIDLLLVIMPGKPSIYPDLLAPSVPPAAAGTFSHSLDIIRQLSEKKVNTVDLFSAFNEERKRDTIAGDSLYLRSDTHFRGRGILTTARVIAERIRQFDWYTEGTIEYGIDTLTVDRHGDIAEMVKLPPFTFGGFTTSFPVEATTCYQVFQVHRDSTGAPVRAGIYKDDYRRSRILVLGDSFSRIYQTDEPRSAGWIAHLARELRQPVASIVNDGGASTLVRKSLERKPHLLKRKKLVVWEIVERDFRFGEGGWKNISLPQL